MSPMRFFGLAALVTLTAFSSVACSSADDSGSDASSEEDELRAADKLLGRYEGHGGLTALTLERSAAGKQTFTGQQTVACVRAPCPAVTISGNWFARSGGLSLYQDSGKTEYRYTLSKDGLLVLKNLDGVVISELQKQTTPAADLAPVLAARGLSKMTLKVDLAEAKRQAEAHPGSVDVVAATGKALDLLLHGTGDGPLAIVQGFLADGDYKDDPCGNTDDGETVLQCVMNDPTVTLTLQPAGYMAEQTEETDQYWIFTLSSSKDAFGDHGIWAIIDRQGRDAYTYTFN